MAPDRLKRNIPILNVLSKAPNKQRKAIIDTATSDQIACICDCANNIINNNIPLTSADLQKLRRYKNLIRYLSKNKDQRKNREKKHYLNQSGGFLPALLIPILSAAGSILAEALINKK